MLAITNSPTASTTTLSQVTVANKLEAVYERFDYECDATEFIKTQLLLEPTEFKAAKYVEGKCVQWFKDEEVADKYIIDNPDPHYVKQCLNKDTTVSWYLQQPG